jgi:hypothetical protein
VQINGGTRTMNVPGNIPFFGGVSVWSGTFMPNLPHLPLVAYLDFGGIVNTAVVKVNGVQFGPQVAFTHTRLDVTCTSAQSPQSPCVSGPTFFTFQDIDWPGLPYFSVGHYEMLRKGLPYEDRTPKLWPVSIFWYGTELPPQLIARRFHRGEDRRLIDPIPLST